MSFQILVAASMRTVVLGMLRPDDAASSIIETSVNFYYLDGATSQNEAIFSTRSVAASENVQSNPGTQSNTLAVLTLKTTNIG